MRHTVLIVGGVVLFAGVGLALLQTRELAAEEVDRGGAPLTLGELNGDPLVRASLAEGQSALFEVCSEDGFAGGWEGVSFEIWHLGEGALADAKAFAQWSPRVKRGASHGCVVFGRWESVLVAGEYGVRLDGRPRTDTTTRVQGRVMAVRALGAINRLAVLLAFLGGLLFVLGLALPHPEPAAFDALAEAMLASEHPTAPSVSSRWATRPGWLRVLVALLLLVAAMGGLAVLQGTFLGLVRALLLAAVEIGLAVVFLAPLADGDEEPSRRTALGLCRPRPGWWILLLAPIVGVLLWLAGSWVSRFIPSTALSPVETFVSYPSGALALAVAAVIVPIAEEIFFRGFIYDTLDRRHGAWVAATVTVVAFAVAHLPQQWGAWGAFASVALTGLVLTVLRVATRSVYPSVVAHLAHNGLITLLALT